MLQTNAHSSPNSFALEALEARVLLSADGLSPHPLTSPGATLDPLAASAIELQENSTFNSSAAALAYDPSQQLDAIFDSGASDLLFEASDFSAEEAAETPPRFSGSAAAEPSTPTTTPMEYAAPNGQALNATLKLNGSKLELVDHSSQKVLKSQDLLSISEVIITGSEKDDFLKIDATDADAWFLKVKFNATGQTTEAGDRLEILGAPDVETTYSPASKGGSGAAKLLKNPVSPADEISFSGVEAVTVSGSSLLTLVTPGGADNLLIEKGSIATTTKISGTSGGKTIVPLTFSNVPNVVLDAATKDPGVASSIPVINLFTGKPTDQVTINGKLTAAGLKNFSVNTGKGTDTFFVQGNDFALPVTGGVFGLNGGEGEDTIFAVNATSSGSVDVVSGNGEFRGTNSTKIGLTSVEKFREAPDRPVIIVPGLGASFAKDEFLGAWFTRIGLAADQLAIDPIGDTYKDLLTTFQNAGYREGSSLFVANWDWRLPLAPTDGTIDGVINGVSGSSISDDQFQSGLDYLGYALKQAADRWAETHNGERPASVDVVAHATGGLIVRAYLQSPAYGANGIDGKALPKINNLTTISTPNRGMTEAYNLLEDNWGFSLDTMELGLVLNISYARIIAGGRIFTPQGDITLSTITTDGTIHGTPSPKLFIAQYLRSLRDVLPTFAFIVTGTTPETTTVSSLNADPLRRNNFLLDLNDGLDLTYQIGQTPLGKNPNRFVDALLGNVTAIYSTTKATPESVITQTGGTGTLTSITTLLGRAVGANEVWYKDQSTADSGDSRVLRKSAVDQLQADGRFGAKIKTQNILDTQAGGTAHAQLLGNKTVLGHALTASGRSPLDSDYSLGGAASFFVKAYRLIKNSVLTFIQEPQLGEQQPMTGTAVINIFQQTLASVTKIVQDKLATEPAPEGSSEAGSDLIKFEQEIIPLIPLPLAPLIRVDGTFLELRNVTYNKTTKQFSGEVGIGADVIALLPNSATLRVTGNDVTGTLKFQSNQFQSFTLKAGVLQLQIKEYLVASAKNLTISPFDTTILTAGTLSAGIPVLGFTGNLYGLEISSTGQFFATGFGVDTPSGLLQKLGLGKFLPLDILGAEVRFLGDANNNGLRDPGETFTLTDFDLLIKGAFNADFFSSFPFTPIIQVGPQNATRAGDEITFSVTIKDGTIAPKNIGPIKIGFRDLKIGQVTLGATVTLGGYSDGVFNPDFGGFLKIESGLENLTGGAQVNITGDFSPDLGKLQIAGQLAVSFDLKSGLIKATDAVLDFGMVIESRFNANGSVTFTISPPSGQSNFLKELSVGLLQVKLGNFLTFQARKTKIDFNAQGNQPLVTFGGSPSQNVSPTVTFNPGSVPDGSLGAIFGTSAGPLNGWGGAVGNFAIGADLSFILLPGFFVQLQVGPNAKFGLPDFLPIELRSVTIQFNDGAIQNGVLVQPSNFSFIFSGGIRESGSWPIFGNFSGLKVNVQKLIDGDYINAIENLSGFSVGIKNVTIGGVSLSGALGLGIVNVNVNGTPQSAFYFRLGGQFFYSGIGGGIDIVFSQYGPILATISAGGLTEPNTGFVFGFKNAGFTFGGSPLPSITDAKELLTNPVFYSPVTIDLGEIERRVQSSLVRSVPTWNDAFTLTGTATVTNIYVQGMISGELTLAANVGLTGPNAGLKILGNGVLNAMGFPMGNAAMLLDLSNPLVPRFDFAASLPAPNNPIGFLFPTNATLTATVDTKGIIELPVVGLGVFFKKLGLHTLGTGQQLFEQVLTNVAANLEADHSLRLAQILLDIDGNGSVSATENSRVITAQFITDRAIGNATAGIPGILLTDFDALLALPPDQFASRVSRGAALIQELL
ncbi:MAG: LEPR-XLL domain-containing protein, partial [Verrucomicrobiota bacterium]